MSPPNLEDTIAAISTPPGEGGIAIVRVSGREAGGIARALLACRNGDAVRLQPRTAEVARAVDTDSGRVVDEVLALWMPGPASYTREDVLEIQCHGGHAVARGVLSAVLRRGARLAEPGEFTLRAFLSGRIDLVQAEAVLDVIRARTEEALGVHQRLLHGQLSRDVEEWQETLTKTLALLEAHLDFPEEDLDPVGGCAVREPLGRVIGAMEGKLVSFGWGSTARDGFTAALVGAPNTGKSSLLNALLGEDRAIVSPVPGTTRDPIEGWSSAGGVPIRLVDTAGLRPARDLVEEEGVRRARRAAANAQLVLFVCDGSRGLTAEEHDEAGGLAREGRTVAVVNKADLGAEPASALEGAFGEPPVLVSALTGQGLPDLSARLGERACGGRGLGPEAPLTRARHRACVEEALRCLRRALEVVDNGGYTEVAASEMHAARRALAGLLGSGSAEEVLEMVFSEFCIGK